MFFWVDPTFHPDTYTFVLFMGNDYHSPSDSIYQFTYTFPVGDPKTLSLRDIYTIKLGVDYD
jgi:hypothetical protein